MSCDWPVDRGCLPDLPTIDDPPGEGQQAAYDAALASSNAAEDIAVQVLWALSGRQFGVCTVVARPCPTPSHHYDWARGISYGGLSPVFVPVYWDGGWRNLTCGCAGRCDVAGPRVIHLPSPVVDVTEVVIAGAAINSTEYTLEGDALYRVGANWPSQDLGRPMGEAGTWSVEYLRGVAPPQGTASMVGTLAAEFLKACSGDKCRLPRTVTVANRNGVTYRAYDPTAIYADGKTGIPEIDLWLSAVNPNHLLSAPSVI